MPGRSCMITSLCPERMPSFFSTVTPGQFPTYCSDPVSALKSVVLPLFGLPARAIFRLLAISNLLFKKNCRPYTASTSMSRAVASFTAILLSCTARIMFP